jgi:hypothetical protein
VLSWPCSAGRAAELLHQAAPSLVMLKLYKRIDGVLHYHEAWSSGRTLYEHYGIVGERGDNKRHPIAKGTDEEDAVLAVLRPAAEAGYQPIEPEDHATLLVEYAVEGMGSPMDLKKRHALEDRLTETLGWTGLGHCDGGSIGSGTMEVSCFVVDFDIAKRCIAADLAATEFSDFTRIYDENADA